MDRDCRHFLCPVERDGLFDDGLGLNSGRSGGGSHWMNNRWRREHCVCLDSNRRTLVSVGLAFLPCYMPILNPLQPLCLLSFLTSISSDTLNPFLQLLAYVFDSLPVCEIEESSEVGLRNVVPIREEDLDGSLELEIDAGFIQDTARRLL
jgi:hypothetical protein